VIAHKILRPVYLSDKVLRVVIADDLKPWLLLVLRSTFGRAQIEELASGNQLSMRNLSQPNLCSISIPLPPPGERDAAVARAQGLLAATQCAERSARDAVQGIERLTSATLGKALRGELVDRYPADGSTPGFPIVTQRHEDDSTGTRPACQCW